MRCLATFSFPLFSPCNIICNRRYSLSGDATRSVTWLWAVLEYLLKDTKSATIAIMTKLLKYFICRRIYWEWTQSGDVIYTVLTRYSVDNKPHLCCQDRWLLTSKGQCVLRGVFFWVMVPTFIGSFLSSDSTDDLQITKFITKSASKSQTDLITMFAKDRHESK